MTKTKPSTMLIAPRKLFILEDHLNSGSILNKPRKLFIFATHFIKRGPTLYTRSQWVMVYKAMQDFHYQLYASTVAGPRPQAEAAQARGATSLPRGLCRNCTLAVKSRRSALPAADSTKDICIYIYTHMYMYANLYMCIYIYIYTYTYMYIHMYMYTQNMLLLMIECLHGPRTPKP